MENSVQFQVNDYIIYGGTGVCIVKDICTLDADIDGIDNTKKYYVLEPVYKKGDVIYSPVDNSRIVIRKTLTKEESHDLIKQIPFIETSWIDDNQLRKKEGKVALDTYDCYELARIIKTVYLRKEVLLREKKSIGQIDDKYFHIAEDLLYGELAISLGIPKEQVENYITGQVENTLSGTQQSASFAL